MTPARLCGASTLGAGRRCPDPVKRQTLSTNLGNVNLLCNIMRPLCPSHMLNVSKFTNELVCSDDLDHLFMHSLKAAGSRKYAA